MAGIILPDGQSWIVSGEAFRSLLRAMRESLEPDDTQLLMSLGRYEPSRASRWTSLTMMNSRN